MPPDVVCTARSISPLVCTTIPVMAVHPVQLSDTISVPLLSIMSSDPIMPYPCTKTGGQASNHHTSYGGNGPFLGFRPAAIPLRNEMKLVATNPRSEKLQKSTHH